MKLDGTMSAVVTGGASGLGFATATALRQAGVKVAIFDFNEENGQRAAAQIGATFCLVNVMDDAAVNDGFARARSANGQERILVNCAGGLLPGNRGSGRTVARSRKTGAINRFDAEDFAGVIGLNTVGTFRCITAAAAGMMELEPLSKDGDRGAIVCTSSVAAQDGQIGQVAYSAAKAAIAGMTLTIARDLADEGIRINTILPGIMATPPMLGMKTSAPAMWDSLNAQVPFPRRMGKPEEFAELALAMLRNTYFNGQAVRLDGAIRMQPR